MSEAFERFKRDQLWETDVLRRGAIARLQEWSEAHPERPQPPACAHWDGRAYCVHPLARLYPNGWRCDTHRPLHEPDHRGSR